MCLPSQMTDWQIKGNDRFFIRIQINITMERTTMRRVQVFWDVTPRRRVNGLRRLKGTYGLRLLVLIHP